METHLTFDNRSKQLGILFKQRITTNENLQLKVTMTCIVEVYHFEFLAKIIPEDAVLRQREGD